jgi:fructose-specific component phosphotransferase system IIB-like protein
MEGWAMVVGCAFDNLRGCSKWVNSKVVVVDSSKAVETSVNSSSKAMGCSQSIVFGISEENTVFMSKQMFRMRAESQMGCVSEAEIVVKMGERKIFGEIVGEKFDHDRAVTKVMG